MKGFAAVSGAVEGVRRDEKFENHCVTTNFNESQLR